MLSTATVTATRLDGEGPSRTAVDHEPRSETRADRPDGAPRTYKREIASQAAASGRVVDAACLDPLG